MENKKFNRETNHFSKNSQNNQNNSYKKSNSSSNNYKKNSSYQEGGNYTNDRSKNNSFKKDYNKSYQGGSDNNRSYNNRENGGYSSSGERKSYNPNFKNNEGFKKNEGYNRNESYSGNEGYNRNGGDTRNSSYNKNQGNQGFRKNDGYKKPFNKKPYVRPSNGNTNYDYPAPAPTEVRLNKYIADAGICSRRNADIYISAGNVTVNGEVMTTLGYRVQPTDEVRFDGKLLSSEKKEYILLNKPKGFITTTNDEKGRKTVMDLVANATNVRILPVGRLDRATTGLLLLTNDGELTKKLTHPTYGVRKIYHVVLDRKLEYKDFMAIQDGLELEDGFIQVDEISYVNDKPKNELGIKIHSGRNRIVRRIFEHLGYQVEKLDRVVFAGLTKKDLPRGHWRFLTPQEVINLRNMK